MADDVDLPSTVNILAMLRTEPANNTLRQTSTLSQSPPQSLVDMDAFAHLLYSPSFKLPRAYELARILDTELTRSIGPVASIYIERYQNQIDTIHSKDQLIELLQSLAGKSANPDTAAEFCERVLSSLNAA